MGDTVGQPVNGLDHQETVTTSQSTMERILSDDNIPTKSQRTRPTPRNSQYPYGQQQIQNPYVQPQQQTQTQPQPQTYHYVGSNQPYTNGYGYQQPTVAQQQLPQHIAPNPQQIQFQNNTTRHLQLQLESQMQHLHLLQQAQQLERQRLDLARQQRDLDSQAAQQLQQNELLHQQQFQQQQQRQKADNEAKARAAALAIAQAQKQKQAQAQTQAQAQAQLQQRQQKQNEDNDSTQDEKYPVIFHWNHGGRVVYVAYSGDNWSHKYRMSRSHNDFSLIMEISPGVYHYKFIVDNQWRCARDQKHVRDANGAYSNVLDVQSHSFQQVMDEKEKKRKREKHKAQYQYTQNLPKSDHYVQDPVVCPIHLHNVILNNNDNDDDDDDDDGLASDDESKKVQEKSNVNTMELPKPLRVSLNHLYVSDKKEEEVVTLGMTERYKDKFFTTVYYTPILRFDSDREGED